MFEFELKQLELLELEEQDQIHANSSHLSSKIEKIRNMILSRLQMPQSTDSFDSILVIYSGFESKYDSNGYFSRMKHSNSLVEKTRKDCKKRQSFENEFVIYLSLIVSF